MNKAEAKALLKQGGKNRGEIKAIYERHINALPMNVSGAGWNKAVSIALAEAAGIPCAFSLKGGTANAVAELMDN